jgi:hypothetical protein
MSYQELLTKVSDPLAESHNGFNHALRAVVELHQPQDITLPDGSWGENCCVCNNGWTYPCRTIQVIEKELNGDKKNS